MQKDDNRPESEMEDIRAKDTSPKRKTRTGPLPEETTEDLVKELNVRQRKNKKMSFDLSSEGELRVVVVYE